MQEDVFTGTVQYVQVLDKDGNVDDELAPDLSDDELQELYYHMVLGRVFDKKAVSLQRQGRIGTYPPVEGQEAAQAGSGFAMREDDWFVPSYREHVVNMVRGVPIEKLFLHWGGDERGLQKDGRNLPESVPVASQVPHAAGVALGEQLDGTDSAVVTYCGDGGTSQGEFYSGMNWAGAFDLPVVCIVQNNGYAISMPREEQTGTETIAQKAFGTGAVGVQVDGNDVLAVYRETEKALERAREDGTPTLIEAVTYRRSMHTTADDPSVYRDEEEVVYWKERDPIQRFETYLEERGLIEEPLMENGEFRDDIDEHPIYVEAKQAVDDAVQAYEEIPEQDVADLFDHHFEHLPPELERQKTHAQEYRGEE